MELNPLQTQTMGSSVEPEMDQIDKILSSKPVLLNNPGTILDQSLYYSFSNAQLVAAECVQNQGRFQQSFSTPQFGGTSSITVPNSSFLESLNIYLELGALGANQFLPRGWGLNAISRLSFILGSSNVSQLDISGDSHAALLFSGCETAEKREKAMRLAGEEYNLGVAQPVGTINKAYFQLQLPWSRITSLCKKLPIDTNLLSNPIIIQITLKNQNEIIGGSGYLSAPTQFLQAKAYATQIDLMDKSLSLKNYMYINPELSYNYPFIFTQSYSVDITNSTTTPVSVNLVQIINADLVGISFHVIDNENISAGIGGANPLSPFNWQRVKDVVLKFNGLVFYDAPGDMAEMYDLQDYPGNGMIPYSVVSAGGAGPYLTFPRDVRETYMSLTRLRNTMFCDHFQNSIRIANNALSLSFVGQTNNPAKVYVTYYYNAVFNVKQGQSALILE